MKNKIIILVIVLFMFITGIIVTNMIIKEKLLKDDNNQVEILRSIYLDFLSRNGINEDSSIVLNESCFKNIVTGEKFDDDNIEKLKSIELIANSTFSYILYSNYNIESSVLTLTLKRQDENEISEQKYKLYVKNNTIKYEEYGVGTNSFTTPANQE